MIGKISPQKLTISLLKIEQKRISEAGLKYFFLSLPLPSALTLNKFRMAGSQKRRRLDLIFLPADRGIEPGMAG